MTFMINGVNYTVASNGEALTITKEGETDPMFTTPVDSAKTPAEALQEVVAAANTFLAEQFPGFVTEFMVLFNELVVTVTGGVPTISIPA